MSLQQRMACHGKSDGIYVVAEKYIHPSCRFYQSL